eukprot:scaffold91545_cov69-Phaeocystis_antarctica.AAC.3
MARAQMERDGAQRAEAASAASMRTDAERASYGRRRRTRSGCAGGSPHCRRRGVPPVARPPASRTSSSSTSCS